MAAMPTFTIARRHPRCTKHLIWILLLLPVTLPAQT